MFHSLLWGVGRGEVGGRRRVARGLKGICYLVAIWLLFASYLFAICFQIKISFQISRKLLCYSLLPASNLPSNSLEPPSSSRCDRGLCEKMSLVFNIVKFG